MNRQNLLQDRILALVTMVMEFGLRNWLGDWTKLDDTNTYEQRHCESAGAGFKGFCEQGDEP